MKRKILTGIFQKNDKNDMWLFFRFGLQMKNQVRTLKFWLSN